MTDFSRVISWAELYEIFHFEARLTVPEFRRAVNVSRRTVSRWESGEARIPLAVYLSARLLAGDLSFYGREWSGLSVRGAAIVGTPYGAIGANEIRALPWVRQLHVQAAKENRRVAGLVVPTPGDALAPAVELKRRRRTTATA